MLQISKYFALRCNKRGLLINKR